MGPAGDASVPVLLARVAASGVQLRVEGGRLRAVPSGRLSGTLAVDVRANAHKLAALVTGTVDMSALSAVEVDGAQRAAAVQMSLYRNAARVRRKLGTGWPGAAERDTRMIAAQVRLAHRVALSDVAV